MKHDRPCVLTVNGGSSSIRFGVYAVGDTRRPRIAGKIDRIGTAGAVLTVDDTDGRAQPPRPVRAINHATAVDVLLEWLEEQSVLDAIVAIGHRVVHGMQHAQPERVTRRLIAELHRITPYAPEHLPRELALIEAFSRRYPQLPQVACFDTAFHRGLPRVATLLPVPRRYAAKGVERFGFHGLSYAYLMEELARQDPEAANARVILAHLGSGASLAAVRDGKSIDTSMGFTPTAGLVMGTRSGDLDPGLAYYLHRTERMTAPAFQRMVNHESGLLGVSGTSADVRDLLVREATDSRAADALDLFCYQAKKWIGSYAAALGGLHTLVFSGGVGENAPLIRQRICDGLGFLGIDLDAASNARSLPLISSSGAGVKVRVIRTDEERMIARSVIETLELEIPRA